MPYLASVPPFLVSVTPFPELCYSDSSFRVVRCPELEGWSGSALWFGQTLCFDRTLNRQSVPCSIPPWNLPLPSVIPQQLRSFDCDVWLEPGSAVIRSDIGQRLWLRC